jgi:hypothetical protein
MRGGSITRSKSKKEGIFLHGLLETAKRSKRPKKHSPTKSPPRSPPRSPPKSPPRSPPRSPPKVLTDRITELEKEVEKCNREKRILEERSPRRARSPRKSPQKPKSPSKPDCIDSINSFKDDECDAKIHAFTNEQFQSFLDNVTKPDNRIVLTIVHKYKKLRSDIYKELAYFKSNHLATIYKINKHRSEKGLPLEPIDFLSFYEYEMRKRALVSSLPKKSSPKKPSPKKTPPKLPLFASATRLPPSRLGLQLGAVAVDISDHDAVRRKIISLRQAQKTKGLSLKEARESFREIVPESNSHYDKWSSYLNIDNEVPEEI